MIVSAYSFPRNTIRAKAVTVNSAGQVLRGSGNRFNGLVDPTDFWQTDKKNFAPRFSFAYDLFGSGKTSLRGGYGLFYSREILGAFILMSGNPPFSELLTVENTLLVEPRWWSGAQLRSSDHTRLDRHQSAHAVHAAVEPEYPTRADRQHGAGDRILRLPRASHDAHARHQSAIAK